MKGNLETLLSHSKKSEELVNHILGAKKKEVITHTSEELASMNENIVNTKAESSFQSADIKNVEEFLAKIIAETGDSIRWQDLKNIG